MYDGELRQRSNSELLGKAVPTYLIDKLFPKGISLYFRLRGVNPEASFLPVKTLLNLR